MDSETPCVLVVDDEVKFADRLAERLQLRGFNAFTAYDGRSAFGILEQRAPENLILDLRLPDIDGIEVLGRTKREFPAVRVVILSGHGSESEFALCRELGAFACFQKPAKIDDLIGALLSPGVRKA